MSLKRLEATNPIELHWRAFELRPRGAPPIPPAYKARIEANRPIFAARIMGEYGIELSEGPFGINTRELHQLKKFADTQDKGTVFHDAALDAYWLHGLDVSDHAVQQDLLRQVSIETPVAEILAEAEYQAQVLLDERIAQENNMTGVPALVFAEKYLVMGAQPLDILKRVADRVEQEAKEEDISNS